MSPSPARASRTSSCDPSARVATRRSVSTSTTAPQKRDLAVQVPGLRVQREVGGGSWPARWSLSATRSYGSTALVAGDRDARVAVLEDRFRGGDAGVSAADDQHVLGAPAAACRDRLDADRGRLQAGLARHRVGLAVGEVVEAAVARGRVQLAPVEGRERGAGAQAVVEADLQRHRAAAGGHARVLAVLEPGALGVLGVQLEERLGVGRQQLRRLGRAGHRVPLARDPAGGQDEREVGVGRVGGVAGEGGLQDRRAGLGGEAAVGVQAGGAGVVGRCGTATGWSRSPAARGSRPIGRTGGPA